MDTLLNLCTRSVANHIEFYASAPDRITYFSAFPLPPHITKQLLHELLQSNKFSDKSLHLFLASSSLYELSSLELPNLRKVSDKTLKLLARCTNLKSLNLLVSSHFQTV